MRDPVAFSSAQLPTAHFHERFSGENLAFWVPHLIAAAQIEPGQRVLDVGCGTGGFARAIAEVVPAAVTGVDPSARFLAFARGLPPLERGAVAWRVGSAEALPVADASVDHVLLSLVLHQLRRPTDALAEAFRALAPGGRVLVRTIAPEDVGERVPGRYVPAMAAADAERMPPLDTIERWLGEAGFVATARRRVLRDKTLRLADEERHLRVEARSRYRFLSPGELDTGVRLMRADAQAHGDHWIDPRPTYILTASKQ
jgi:ubiquinone/menaquinone biosynthesis C-methylase UbiE